MDDADPHRVIVRSGSGQARPIRRSLVTRALATAALVGLAATGCGTMRVGDHSAAPGDFAVQQGVGASSIRMPAPVTPLTSAGATLDSCSGVTISTSQNPQSVINAYGSNTSFCLTAGVHRVSGPITPKAGDTLGGWPGAIVRGSVVVGSWGHSGNLYYATGYLPGAYSGAGVCENQAASDCTKAEQIFVDGVQYHRVQSTSSLRSGTFVTDYTNNRIYLSVNPAGHTVELSKARMGVQATAGGVVIRNVIVDQVASLAQRGAIELGTNAVVTHSTVRNNHAHGIFINGGSGSQILDSLVQDNGQLGVGQYHATGTVIERNRISGNNTDGFWVADWESGGIKVTHSAATIAYNEVAANRGVGIWCDVECNGVTISHNMIYGNLADGVRYEISYNGNISDNFVAANGFNYGRGASSSLWDGAGINVNTSSGITVEGNIVSQNRNAVSLQSRTRGNGSNGAAYKLQDVVIRHNWMDLSMTSGSSLGIVGNSSSPRGPNVLYWGNTYHVGSQSARFNMLGSVMSAGAWQHTGQDPDSRFE